MVERLYSYLAGLDNIINSDVLIEELGITQERWGVMAQVHADLDNMLSDVLGSSMDVRFQYSDDPSFTGGLVSKDISTGQYVVTIDRLANPGFEIEVIAHEVVHLNQVLRGDIGFDHMGNGGKLVGMEDEVQAYQISLNIFEGFKGVTPVGTVDSIRQMHPGEYDNVPVDGGSCPVHG